MGGGTMANHLLLIRVSKKTRAQREHSTFTGVLALLVACLVWKYCWFLRRRPTNLNSPVSFSGFGNC